MLIVVEGPDCAGKTTLVHQLAERLSHRNERIQLRHCSALKKPALVEYEQRLDDYMPGTGDHIIYDRLHLGELIYGPIKRGGSKLDPAAWMHVELNLAVKGALLVLVDADNDTLLFRHEARGETFVSPAELLVVADAYRRLQHRHSPVTQFNALRAGALALPSILIGLADALEDAAVMTNPFTTLVGKPQMELHNPQLLLLGDRRGPGNNQGHTKAFVPYPSTSGHYLMRAISPFAWLGYTCIANAWEEDIEALWCALGNPHVVALGQEAHKLADDMATIPHGTVPHPQWVRRFHHKEVEQYTAAILEAAQTKEEVKWQS